MAWRALVLASGLVTVGCTLFVRPETAETGASAPKATAAASRESQQNVEVVWRNYCQNCHGERGQGGGAGTRTLLTRELFDQRHDRPFFETIKHGVPKGGMEAFGGTLSDEQIWGQVVHIRELQLQALGRSLGAPSPASGVYRSQRQNFRVEVAIDRNPALQTPWAIEWLPDGRALVTNRPGSMAIFKNGRLEGTVEAMPAVRDMGQGGLLDVAVHPDYARNGWVYLALSDPEPGGPGALTKVVRGKLARAGSTSKWTDQQTIFEVDKSHYTNSGIHFGSRLVFDGQGHLFFSIGERGEARKAQSLRDPNGKMIRLQEDGSIPKDNPFAGQGSPLPAAIWSYGHRNPQGLALDGQGGLWSTEHAPRGGDEVNRIEKGRNYGWPVISFGINYSNAPLTTPWASPAQNMTLPIFRWLPSTGACGLDIAIGSKFPNWDGDLFAGGLVGENLDRLRIKKGQVVEHERLLHGRGRVRDVRFSPDGYLYVVLNDPDMVLRIVPA